MAEEKTGRFPDPHEFQAPPELEGWEEMYPSHYLFSKDREKWEKSQFWYQDKIHDPEPMPPLDLIFQEAWQIVSDIADGIEDGDMRDAFLRDPVVLKVMSKAAGETARR